MALVKEMKDKQLTHEFKKASKKLRNYATKLQHLERDLNEGEKKKLQESFDKYNKLYQEVFSRGHGNPNLLPVAIAKRSDAILYRATMFLENPQVKPLTEEGIAFGKFLQDNITMKKDERYEQFKAVASDLSSRSEKIETLSSSSESIRTEVSDESYGTFQIRDSKSETEDESLSQYQGASDYQPKEWEENIIDKGEVPSDNIKIRGRPRVFRQAEEISEEIQKTQVVDVQKEMDRLSQLFDNIATIKQNPLMLRRLFVETEKCAQKAIALKMDGGKELLDAVNMAKNAYKKEIHHAVRKETVANKRQQYAEMKQERTLDLPRPGKK